DRGHAPLRSSRWYLTVPTRPLLFKWYRAVPNDARSQRNAAFPAAERRSERGIERMPPTSIPHVDVLVIGAGLAGVGAAYHLRTLCPSRSFVILEGRGAIGGT